MNDRWENRYPPTDEGWYWVILANNDIAQLAYGYSTMDGFRFSDRDRGELVPEWIVAWAGPLFPPVWPAERLNQE